MNHGYQLKTDAEFFLAILFSYTISITQDGEYVGNGKIISQNNNVIKTIDACYFKSSCTFTVCETATA